MNDILYYCITSTMKKGAHKRPSLCGEHQKIDPTVDYVIEPLFLWETQDDKE